MFPDMPELLRRNVIDLTGASEFCMRQAECAAPFTYGVELRAPGHFVLKSPFRENFLASLFAYIHPEANFSAAETVACALPRHAVWYLGAREIDRIRSRFYEEMSLPLEPVALHGPHQYWQGLIRENGEFATNAEKQGTPAILVFQELSGDAPSLALEIRGRDVGKKDPAFRKTLLESALKETLLKLSLQKPHRGRPHDADRAELIAHARDHEHLEMPGIATKFCDCRQSRHGAKCFDRLNSQADSFYSIQRSRLEKLVKSQAKRIPE
jgi:hypothetical protein